MLGKYSDRPYRAHASGNLRLRSAAWVLMAAGAALASGCGSLASGQDGAHYNVVARETFGSANTYSRLFDASPERTCEAARRALLSQGYLINVSKDKEVEGQKTF